MTDQRLNASEENRIAPSGLSGDRPTPGIAPSSPTHLSRPSESFPLNSSLNPQNGPFPNFQLFLTTFFTIFVAEIGDKTQVTTLLMSAESQAPWVVFVGAGSALVLTTLLGVFVGRWLSKHVSIETLETITGAILIVISLWLLWDVISM